MNIIKSFTIASIIGICATLSNADINKVGNHNIGAGAGFITGYGLSYRQWIGKWGFQFTAAPFHREDDYYERSVVSVGLTGLRTLKENRVVNLFAYCGPHFFYYKDRDVYTYERYMNGSYSYDYNDDEVEKTLFVGAGPGLDFHFLWLSISLMGGITAKHEFVHNTNGAHFSGEIAIYYSF